MKNFRSALRAGLVVAITLTIVSSAQAQATRTWVSGTGDDVNPCSRTAPCKTFAGAYSKTAAGGEIDALDAGGYGTINITKSLTIDGTGTFAAILASGTTGININIPEPTDPTKGDTSRTVRLRGLSINGTGHGVTGIRVIAANKVSLENLVIDGFDNNGIDVTGPVQVFVRNTIIRNNAGSGINVGAGGGQVTISDVAVVYNGTGFTAPKGAVVSFKNNVIYGNKKEGDSPSPN